MLSKEAVGLEGTSESTCVVSCVSLSIHMIGGL